MRESPNGMKRIVSLSGHSRLCRGFGHRKQDYKMKRLLLFSAVTLLGIPASFAGMPIPQEVKKCVCFIFAPQSDGKLAPNGTGFFVNTQKPDSQTMHVYLVTAKHVLKPDPTKPEFFPFITLRLTKKAGGIEAIPVPLVFDGEKQTVFMHADPTVDLAVITVLPSPERYDFKTLPMSFVAGKKDIKSLGAAEGSDVFFTGMFTPHLGKDQNYPVVRFGRISLMSEERIVFMDAKRELYLIETFSFGGNSGSPCFLHLGPDRKPGSLTLGNVVLKLLGVVSGTYQKGFPLVDVPTASKQLSLDNMGISAVTPAYLLMEVILGKPLKTKRGY